MYDDLAWTWPIISPPSHYRAEARQFWGFLRRSAIGRVQDVLHLGCGGGHVDSQLKRFVRIAGIDVSPAMLRLAKRLNPDVTYERGDMRTLSLGRTFDGALISDAVDYMQTPEDLTRAFVSAFRHLRAGGAFVTYAEHTRERFEPNLTRVHRGRKGREDIVFIENLYDPTPRDTTMEATFVYLIRRSGRLKIETDRHVLGLFPEAAWRRALRDAGFEILHAGPDPSAPEGDRTPWFVGRKPM
jgi:SAM-dependent methyltransferase